MNRRLYLLFGVLFLVSTACRAGVSVVDDLHRTVTLPSSAQRVVSLAPSITETLFAIGAGDQVVGVTDYCNYPEEAKQKPRVGGVVNPNLETILSMNPDLIILSMEGNVREDFNKLVSFGVPVFVTNPRSLEGIYKSITDIGALCGRASQAGQLVDDMQLRENAITARRVSYKPRALFLVSLQPLIVVGSGSFLAELLELAGAFNCAGSSYSSYPTYSRESVLAENPEILLVTSDIVTDLSGLVALYPEWKQIDAVRTGNVFRIDADMVSRPGPRAIEALETLFHIIQKARK